MALMYLDFGLRDAENSQAADRAFPNEGRARTRYTHVSVLLLRWEDDEMNVSSLRHSKSHVIFSSRR